MSGMRNTAASLAEARKAAGSPSYRQVRDEVRDRIGIYCPTEETIRAYHRADDAPKTFDLLVVCALADVYGVEVSSLSEHIARQLAPIRDLVARSRCFAESPGHSP